MIFLFFMVKYLCIENINKNKNKKMKRFIAMILIINILLNFLIFEVNASDEEVYFIVTAYYSPVPNQKSYLTGNYESEKRLNGEWIRWASGKGVFSWMLAAPITYKFGTKIYLEWLWIWEVSDRGWAIVTAGNRWYTYDRIDIWMWYWEEWLKRALNWWKRQVKWYIVPNSSNISISINNISAPNWATNWLKKAQSVSTTINKPVLSQAKPVEKPIVAVIKETKVVNNLTIFDSSVTNSSQIKELQKILKELKLYNWEQTWVYNDIIDSIYDYQISKWIVTWLDTLWAWNFWPKTRSYLKETYKNYLNNEEIAKQEKIKAEARKKELEQKYKYLEELSLKKAEEKIKNIWTPKFWEVSQSVRELQKTLNELWFFKNKDTAIYWDLTKQSILAYQIEKKLVTTENDLWAWLIWPKTLSVMKNDLKLKYLNENATTEKINLSEMISLIWNKA